MAARKKSAGKKPRGAAAVADTAMVLAGAAGAVRAIIPPLGQTTEEKPPAAETAPEREAEEKRDESAP